MSQKNLFGLLAGEQNDDFDVPRSRGERLRLDGEGTYLAKYLSCAISACEDQEEHYVLMLKFEVLWQRIRRLPRFQRPLDPREAQGWVLELEIDLFDENGTLHYAPSNLEVPLSHSLDLRFADLHCADNRDTANGLIETALGFELAQERLYTVTNIEGDPLIEVAQFVDWADYHAIENGLSSVQRAKIETFWNDLPEADYAVVGLRDTLNLGDLMVVSISAASPLYGQLKAQFGNEVLIDWQSEEVHDLMVS